MCLSKQATCLYGWQLDDAHAQILSGCFMLEPVPGLEVVRRAEPRQCQLLQKLSRAEGGRQSWGPRA